LRTRVGHFLKSEKRQTRHAPLPERIDYWP
jgi:hypothetical protein